MASELGRIVGNLFKAKDLGGGEAAGERGLLHLPWSPADQGGQRGCRQVEFGGDSWPDGVVTKLPLVLVVFHFLFIGNNIATRGVANQTKTIKLVGIQILSFL